MIVITKIETHEVESLSEIYAEIYEYQNALAHGENPCEPTYDPQVMKEVVHGRRYRNSNGVDVVVGVSSAAAMAIGLSLKDLQELDSLQEKHSKLRRDLNRACEIIAEKSSELMELEGILYRFSQLSLLQRLWYSWKLR